MDGSGIRGSKTIDIEVDLVYDPRSQSQISLGLRFCCCSL